MTMKRFQSAFAQYGKLLAHTLGIRPAEARKRYARQVQCHAADYTEETFTNGLNQLQETWYLRTGFQSAFLAVLVCIWVSALTATLAWDWSKPRLQNAYARTCELYAQTKSKSQAFVAIANPWIEKQMARQFPTVKQAVERLQPAFQNVLTMINTWRLLPERAV